MLSKTFIRAKGIVSGRSVKQQQEVTIGVDHHVQHNVTETAPSSLTHIHPYYLISEVYDGKFKYYRTPRVFAVEIRK